MDQGQARWSSSLFLDGVMDYSGFFFAIFALHGIKLFIPKVTELCFTFDLAGLESKFFTTFFQLTMPG